MDKRGLAYQLFILIWTPVSPESCLTILRTVCNLLLGRGGSKLLSFLSPSMKFLGNVQSLRVYRSDSPTAEGRHRCLLRICSLQDTSRWGSAQARALTSSLTRAQFLDTQAKEDSPSPAGPWASPRSLLPSGSFLCSVWVPLKAARRQAHRCRGQLSGR